MSMARPNQGFQGAVGGGGFGQPQQFQGGPNKGGGTADQQTPFGGQSSYGAQTGWGQPQQQQATHPFQGFQAPQYSGVQGGGWGQPQQQFQGGPGKGGGGFRGNVPPAPWQSAPAMGALPDLDRLGAGIPPLQTAGLYNQMRINPYMGTAQAPVPWQTAMAPLAPAPWQSAPAGLGALGLYDRMPTRDFSLPVMQPPAGAPLDRIPEFAEPDFQAREQRLEGDMLGREPRQALEPLPDRQASLAKRLGITGDQYADQVDRERRDRGDAGLERQEILGLDERRRRDEDSRRQMDMEMDMEMDMARDAGRQAQDQQQQRMDFERMRMLQEMGQGQRQLGQRGSEYQQSLLGGLGGARPQMRRPILVPRTPRVRKPLR
jgi:hypothetical protein